MRAIETGTRQPPVPPDDLLGGIGAGDFVDIGAHDTDLIKRFAHLRPDDRVLDIGCGLGRVAWPLAQELTHGSYEGIDAVAPYIDWCRTSLELDAERFKFHYVDIHNSFYNPTGAVRPEDYRFPWPDGEFTLEVALSLFTHLSDSGTRNYLREIFRTLAKGGRLLASFFVLDGYARSTMKRITTNPEFTETHDYGMTANADDPDAAIAFDSEWLLQAFQSAGFEIVSFHRGMWRDPTGPTYQDLVIARRP